MIFSKAEIAMLYRYAMKVTPTNIDKEDSISIVNLICATLDHIPSNRDKIGFTSNIIKRRIIDHVRHVTSKGKRPRDRYLEDLKPMAISCSEDDEIYPYEVSYEYSVFNEVDLSCFIKRLSKRHRNVIIAIYYEGKNPNEMAKGGQLSHCTIRKIHDEAIMKLREMIDGKKYDKKLGFITKVKKNTLVKKTSRKAVL